MTNTFPRQKHSPDARPWYKHFWAWFVFALPATAVAAGLLTVVIATRNADSLVSDNYYKEGLAINVDLHREKLARDLGLQASLVIDSEREELRLQLDANSDFSYPQALRVRLIHPFDASSDREFVLHPMGHGLYLQKFDHLAAISWHAEISPLDTSAEEDNWKIVQKLER